MARKNNKQYPLWLPEDDFNKGTDLAWKKRISFGELVRRLLKKELTKQK